MTPRKGQGEGTGWSTPIALLSAGCIGWAGVSASLLHLVADRSGAAWIVPVGLAWGATACIAAWTARDRRLSPWIVLGLGLLVRLVLTGSPPLLSDDVFRLLWEGQLLAAGGNPFLTAPIDVAGLDPELRARVNHPSIPSIYPPVALLWFRLLWHGGGTVLAAQVWTALADLAVLGALLVARRGQPTWPALLYALHPLAALESAAGAHIDVPAVALLAWGCVLHPRTFWTGLLATLGAGVKLLPALLLPGLYVRGRPRSLAALTAGVGVGLFALAVLAVPVLEAGPALLDGFTAYATRWSFNGLAWPLADRVVGPLARPVLVGLGALATLVALIVGRGRPWRVWLGIGTAFLALSPTAHPWYGLWVLVPGLALGWWPAAVIGVSLLGAYGVLSGYDAPTGTWSEPPWLWASTWVPALVSVGVWGVWRTVRWRASARV